MIRLLPLLWAAFALNYIDRQMVYSMLPALTRDLGFTPASLAWIGTVFLWTYTLAMPVAGALSDRLRRDRMIVASLFLWSLATLGCGLANSPAVFQGWRAFMGLSEAMYYPTAMALIASLVPASQRSRALGIHQSAQFAGVVIGGFYGGWAADNTGWRRAFWIAGGLGVAYSLVLARALPENRARSTPERRGELQWSACFGALAVSFAAFCSMQWVFFAWFPTFLQERFGLSMTESGWNATAFTQGATIVGILLGGALADQLRRTVSRARLYVAGAGVFFSAPFAYLAFSATALNEARLYSLCFGLFAGCLSANAFAAAFELFPEDTRGLAAGVLNGVGGVASGGMILLAGLYKEQWGFGTMLGWTAAIAMISAAVLAKLAAGARLSSCDGEVSSRRA
jgi:MFS transporter, Spinster family, sphingosine-1-phosphate transporter